VQFLHLQLLNCREVYGALAERVKVQCEKAIAMKTNETINEAYDWILLAHEHLHWNIGLRGYPESDIAISLILGKINSSAITGALPWMDPLGSRIRPTLPMRSGS
jgi:hypothetical protein